MMKSTRPLNWNMDFHHMVEFNLFGDSSFSFFIGYCRRPKDKANIRQNMNLCSASPKPNLVELSSFGRIISRDSQYFFNVNDNFPLLLTKVTTQSFHTTLWIPSLHCYDPWCSNYQLLIFVQKFACVFISNQTRALKCRKQ